MQFTIHENAENDLDRLFELDEDGVGYIDQVFHLISSTPNLIDDLFSKPYFRDYDPPNGSILGIEVKRIISLCQQGYNIRRIKFDEILVQDYRVIFSANSIKQPNGTYINEIEVLAIVNKKIDSFNYEDDHKITLRIKNNYEK